MAFRTVLSMSELSAISAAPVKSSESFGGLMKDICAAPNCKERSNLMFLEQLKLSECLTGTYAWENIGKRREEDR